MEERAEKEKMICRLEDDIRMRRKNYWEKPGNWFSYWLYENRVEGYRNQQCADEQQFKELMRTRLLDVINQEMINLDEHLWEEEERARINAALRAAEELLNLL